MRLRAVSHSEGGERGAEGDFSVRYPLFTLCIPSRRLGGNALLIWIAHPLLRRGTRAQLGLRILRGVRRLVFEKEHLLTQLDALFAEAASESLFSFVSEDVQEVERLCGQLFLGAL